VDTGGTVLADHSTGLYDEHLLRRAAGVLDRSFGIDERSVAWRDQHVAGGASTARGKGLPLAEHGLRGKLGERRDGGDANVERAQGRGRAVYLNAPVVGYPRWRLDEASIEPARDLRRRVRAVLQRAGVEPPCEVRGEGLPTCLERVSLRLRDGRRVLAIRCNALDAPAVLLRLVAKGPCDVTIEFAEVCTLRELGGESLGAGTRFQRRLDPYGALFLEVTR
jgi:hypothetical protein